MPLPFSDVLTLHLTLLQRTNDSEDLNNESISDESPSTEDNNIEHDVFNKVDNIINISSTSENITFQPTGLVLSSPPLVRSSRLKHIQARFKGFCIDSP